MTETLSDFYNMEVKRTGNKAEIIFDYFEGKPVRLFDFKTDASKTDIEILEEGFMYYQELCKQIEKI